MARLRRQTFRSGPRRKTQWIGGDVSATTALSIGAATSTVNLTFDTRVVGVPDPFTIIRLRGEFMIYSDQSAQDEDPFGAIGAMIVNGEAFDAGVASIPTPYTESFDNGWFYHQYWSAPVAATPASGIMTMNHARYIIDSKGMRKVVNGDVFVLVIENKSAAHAAALTVNLRMLIKLH